MAGKPVYVKVALQVHDWMEMIIGMDTLNKVARSRAIVQRNMDHWWPKFQPLWSFSAKTKKRENITLEQIHQTKPEEKQMFP